MNPLYPLKALLGTRTVTLVMDRGPDKPPIKMTMHEKYLARVIDAAVEKGYSISIEKMI
jgi:hypothetical protein